MAASAKGRLVPVLAVAAALAAVLLYRAPFSKVPGIPDSDGCIFLPSLSSPRCRICAGN
jgi:allantoinase/DNA mismatch repair protein MutS2